MGVVAGTELLTVNGRALADFLDWEFLTADDELVIEARLPGGETSSTRSSAPRAKSLGVELEPPTVRRCANQCEFCFIEGLPQGLRKPLYIRDDDYRLSFAYGNFATLSNMKERDIARILEYRLSPLYVSVHATPWEARKVLLNNPRVPNIVDQLTRLAEGGIQFHCQMVVVPGLNDGEVLEQSLRDLWDLGDAVMSASRSCRSGVTQFSHLYNGRADGSPRTRAASSTRVERWEAARARRAWRSWVFGSDELYLLAGAAAARRRALRRVRPDRERRRRRRFASRQRVRDGLDSLPRLDGKRIGVVTGVSMAPLMPELLDAARERTGAAFVLIRWRTRSSVRRRPPRDCSSARTSDVRSPDGMTSTSRSFPPRRSTTTACSSTTSVRRACATSLPDAGLSLVRLHRRAGARREPCSRTARGMSIPVVAIVGRPNVGKSALFNRIIGEDSAIVSEEAGTTRDRHFSRAEWNGRAFWLVDTGGLSDDPQAPMDREIRRQVATAVDEADMTLFVVDAKVGVHPSDSAVVEMLRATGKPWLLVANKVDDPEQRRTSTSSISSAPAIRSPSRR